MKGSPVVSGLTRLITDRRDLLGNKRIGLLCHPASVDARLFHAAELLSGAGAALVRLFGPEHGIRGDAQDMIGVGHEATDDQLGLPVVSLYGADEESLRPGARHLEDLDLLCVDLQDVGSRYYTFIWSLVMAMEACAGSGTEVLVLDRPNPLGGLSVEGPGIEPGFASFVGYHPLPVRHGLTIGEVARLCKQERDIGVTLEVLPMEGWHRGMLADDTGLPWVLPSPNMPTLDTALVYPGLCLLEGTNISEGRGTTRPFEIIGAPWVNAHRLAAALEQEELAGVAFRPLGFRPTFHKHQGQFCGGVQIHVTDRRSFRPLRTGVALLLHLRRLWPGQFQWRSQAYEFVRQVPAIDLLAGGAWLREGLERGDDLEGLTSGWPACEAGFLRRRQPFLLYPEVES